MNKIEAKKAFTLIEFLLVVIITGVLAAIMLPSFLGRSEEARKTRAKSKIESITALALDMFEADTKAVIPLKHLKASEVVAQVINLVSDSGNITVDSQGNILVIHDNTHNIEQIRRVVHDLDQTPVTRVFTFKHAMAEDIENVLRTLVTNPDTFQAEPRTNRIIICDGASQVTIIENIIKKLDCEDARFTQTYHLEHTSASHGASIIESFIARQLTQRTYLDKAAEKRGTEAYKPLEQITPESPSPSSHKRSELHRTGRPLGSAPSLAGTRSSAQAAVFLSSSLNPPAPPPPSGSRAASGSETIQRDTQSLGTAGTIIADDRINAVTVTETLTTPTKIEQMIQQLDIPVKSYSYTVKHRQMDSLAVLSSARKGLADSELTLLLPTIVSASETTHEPVLSEAWKTLIPKPAEEAGNDNDTEQNNTG